MSRLEVVSSRQPHREPEVVRHAAPPDDVEFVNHAQHDGREALNPSISTLVAHDVGPGNGICGPSSDRVVKVNRSSNYGEVVNPSTSTIGASQRGAEVGVNSQKDPALAVRTEAEPSTSTVSLMKH